MMVYSKETKYCRELGVNMGLSPYEFDMFVPVCIELKRVAESKRTSMSFAETQRFNKKFNKSVRYVLDSEF